MLLSINIFALFVLSMEYSRPQEADGCFCHLLRKYSCQFIFPTFIYALAWIGFVKSLMGFLNLSESNTYDKALLSLAILVLIASTFIYVLWMLYLYRTHYDHIKKEELPHNSKKKAKKNVTFMRVLPNLSCPETVYYQRYTDDSLPELPRGFNHPNASSTPRDQSSGLSRIPIITSLDPIVEEDLNDQSALVNNTYVVEREQCDSQSSHKLIILQLADQSSKDEGAPEPCSDANYHSALDNIDNTSAQLESISLETSRSAKTPSHSTLPSTNFMNV